MSRRRSAHGTIPGETVPQPEKVVEVLDAGPETSYGTHWPSVAPLAGYSSIYEQTCLSQGFDPIAEKNARHREQEALNRLGFGPWV